MNEPLNAFAEDLRQQVLLEADLEGEEAISAEAYTSIVLEQLEEAGEIAEGRACYYRARGVEISGYGVDDELGTLDLFGTVYHGDVPPLAVPAEQVETTFRRLQAFWAKTADGYHATLEDSSEAFDMALHIHQVRSQISRMRLFLLTDGVTRPVTRPATSLDGVDVSFHVWDLARLQRLVTSGQRQEPILIDFLESYGSTLPCLPAPSNSSGYASYLAIVPGAVLADIYGKFGPRLLELNVRSFLQARGKVNQGIRRTILERPERFLAYNNGISCTVARLETDGSSKRDAIVRAHGLQVVNGGQTTASLYHALTRDKADLSRVYVAAKISVVEPSLLGTVVPLISRYANSQNRISEADFSANDPFHVRIEELSRTVWAPAVGGSQRQTRWFYERARGQYADALARQLTPGRKRQFKQEHPPSQRFTKTDLAKFENAWDQLPHLVSRGAQKNFAEFTLRLAHRGKVDPDQSYFERLVAKAILFRRAERLVSQQHFGGYRANIVAYAIAYLAHLTAHRLDLDGVWRTQDISPATGEALVTIAHEIHGVLIQPPGGGNVTEWAKRETCWKAVRDLDLSLPSSLSTELISLDRARQRQQSGIDRPNAEESELIEEVARVPAERWFALSHWAKETSNLAPWQRGIAFSLGKLAQSERPASRKQAAQGVKILEEARRLGFRDE